MNYNQILNVSQELTDLVSATRADSANASAGPKIAHTKNLLSKVQTVIDNAQREDSALYGTENLIKMYGISEMSNLDINNLRSFLRNSDLGYVQSFTTLGLEATEVLFRDYFPHYQPYFETIFSEFENNILKSGRLSVKMRDKIYDTFVSYFMTQYDYFNINYTEDGITFPNRELVLSKFVNDFKSISTQE